MAVSTQTSRIVLKLSGWNLHKSLIYTAGSISVRTSRIGPAKILSARVLLIGLFAAIHHGVLQIHFIYILPSSCGPIFGAGADLLISSNCNTNMDSYSNLPHSYDGANAAHLTLFGDYNFTITDYEVYTLASPGGSSTSGTSHTSSHNQNLSANGQAPGVPTKAKYDRY